MDMKRILFISLVLALMLSLILPTVAMAAKPAAFSAQGVMSSIDDGTVKQLGNSGLWLVKDRHITGTLTGDLVGDYTITYGGVFRLTTQEGQLAGRMEVGSTVIALTGSVEPLTFTNFGAPILSIHGNWTVLKGEKANGSYQAYMVFVPDAAGHVVQVLDSAFIMTGKFAHK
jgi:hypothetical protein